MKEYIETLKWFEKFYDKNKKLVDIIIKDDKKKMIKYKIPDWLYLITGEYKEIEVYRIKGYTKFNWNELMRCGTTLVPAKIYGIPQVAFCRSNYYPSIRTMNDNNYLDEDSLKRLKDVFEELIINLEYYKKFKDLFKSEVDK